MALGYHGLQEFALPSYWDAATLEKFRLASGETYDQLVADIGAALGVANGDILSDPLTASLCSVTTELTVEREINVSNGFQTHTEFGRPDQKRGATVGWMLPLNAYDRGLGWTWDMLRKARRAQIDADVASAIRDLKDIWQKTILSRLFKSTYTAVGSAGRSMPLADGGTAESAYIPIAVPNRGGTFLYTHDHISTAATISQANLETAVGNLWEHGYDAPYDLLVAQADLGSGWVDTATITGFVPRSDPLIRYGATADLANVDASYMGVVDTKYGAVRMRASGRLPTTNWAVWKSFGPLDPRNPLAIRVGTDYGANAVLLRGDHIREYPLEDAIIFVEFGVGVTNRVGAVVTQTTGGAYSDPTIT